MRDSVIITLSAPLRVIDRDVTTLTVREPTGRDIMRAGMPMRFGGDGMVEIEPKSMGRLMKAVAGIPDAAIEAMPAADWLEVSNAVMGFLGPTAASSTDTSSAPTSGAT